MKTAKQWIDESSWSDLHSDDEWRDLFRKALLSLRMGEKSKTSNAGAPNKRRAGYNKAVREINSKIDRLLEI